MQSPPVQLPYRDRKSKGAADFYFAVDATFRFIAKKFGRTALIRYWQSLGEDYMKPVWENWRQDGLPAVAAYWRAFFAAEPGAEVDVEESADAVTLRVRKCPAISHLQDSGREIFPEFCQHCYFVSEAAANRAKLTVRVEGGAGSCTQVFCHRRKAPLPQDLSAIRLNKSKI